jgi:hypothetical protein
MKEIYNGVFSSDNNDNVYIIGDMHGDYQCLVHCLVDLCEVTKAKKIYNDTEFDTPNREYLSWKKENNSVVVFCGDMIHRKRFDEVLDDECSDVYIVKTLLRLKKEANKYGGDIIIISGNHEIMTILYPHDNMYTSEKNIEHNEKYFTDVEFINKYIANSYAFVKIDDILIAHGGLCSDYLDCLDKFVMNMETNNEPRKNNESEGKVNTKKLYKINNDGNSDKMNEFVLIGGSQLEFGDKIVKFINDKYKDFFTNYSKKKINKNDIAYDLFINYDPGNKKEHNLFWCRQWGYNTNCPEMAKILNKVKCSKMIIAHCPQFLSPNEPKMINFECKTGKSNDDYSLARVDLGMSRSFDDNSEKNFMSYLFYNYNRKMAVLKLTSTNGYLSMGYNKVITKKLSCIQYLLLKYGLTKQEWLDNGIDSNWLGFEYVSDIIKNAKENFSEKDSNKYNKFCSQKNSPNFDSITCLLYPVIINDKHDLKSIAQYKKNMT